MSDTCCPPWPHEVYVIGEWHNDNTAGVSVMCATCDYERIGDGYDSDDRMTMQQVVVAVAEHERHVRANTRPAEETM